MLINKKSRKIDDNCNFIYRIQKDVRRILFDKEIKQVIVSNEAIVVIDAPVKDRCMVVVWKIVYSYECFKTSSRMWFSN